MDVRRVLIRWACVALLLLGLVAPAEAQDAREDLLMGCLLQTYRYGNYVALERILNYVKRLRQEKNSSQGLSDILAIELICKLAEGQYASGLALAQSVPPGSPPELTYAANLGLAVGGYHAGRPELTDRYLPLALAYTLAKPELAGDRFLLEALAFQREFEKNPAMQFEVGLRKHDEAYAHLATFKPSPTDASGVVIFEGAGLWMKWLGQMTSYARLEQINKTIGADWKLLLTLTLNAQEALAGDRPAMQFNPQFVLGQAGELLDQAEGCLGRKQIEDALKLVDVAENLFAGGYAATVETVDKTNHEQIQADLAKAGLPGQPPLAYSLLDGSLSLTKSRADILRARLMLAGPSPDPQKVGDLLKSASLCQQAARRGLGFLGLRDVRFAELEALSILKPAGWRDETAKIGQELLADCRQMGFRPGEIVALTFLGDLSSVQRAVELIEDYVQESGDVSLRNAAQRAYDRLTELQIGQGQTQAAADTLGRSQQLDAVVLAKNLPAVQALRDKKEALESELTSRRGLGQDTKVIEELIAKTKAEFYTELLNIKKENPQYESMLAVRPVNFSKLQKQIPANTCVVQYFPASESLFIFMATNQDLRIHKVTVPGERLSNLVTDYRQRLTRSHTDGPEASELYKLLIQPIEADMATKEVLAFIPTSTLNYLPLQALKAPDGHYLIEKKQCVSIVKSSDLESLASPPTAARGGVLALGNPDGSLPAATAEAQAITALFPGSKAYLGREATAAHLAASRTAGYLHLATHGVLDARDSSGSYLLVADGDQHLKVPQIFDLKLDGVRLVTLSACQTAVGKSDSASGSELTTLAFAFSVAGTNSVVASLWSISDASTKELMTAFYSGLKAGKPISQALQQAELKLLKDPRYKSPYFWAPFVLLGDWR